MSSIFDLLVRVFSESYIVYGSAFVMLPKKDPLCRPKQFNVAKTDKAIVEVL